ncbi:MAG: 3,4-dihydroxy-2-butanone-4-phosphate synthase [Caulobacterales bacterium 32-67-6]|jgi:3,4-dihydroxy 2-butanone 4-phosphate synthase/GTP cyclohydrolase II|nr:MAG: 3,4-dihydroxy-2-butanone-4-phosphate synthase [Caulobacterales bacterium 32-67-6]
MTTTPDTQADAAERAVSPIEEIIEEARNGRPYILVDAEDRENEGDVIIPAQFATPAQINFMARHARGLICLSITAERARTLRLPPMTADNGSGHGTAFTISIEAQEGVTTGISAHDRAHTIAVAVDPTKGPDDIVSPGHVFPLVARPGGVLVRAGHTEAAVDISRLAGLNPAGVICEIMRDDGTMARLPDLIEFARRHGLKIGTIADLIAYRRRTERQVERVLETPFESAHGAFRMVIYRNILDHTEHVVLTKGRIAQDRPTLVRMHRVDFAADLLGAVGPRRDHVPQALKALAEHDGAGVAVFIRDSNPAWLSERYGQDGAASAPANTLRDYGVGAQILLDLGVRDLILLSNADTVLPGSAGYGLKIVGRQPLG